MNDAIYNPSIGYKSTHQKYIRSGMVKNKKTINPPYKDDPIQVNSN